MINIKNGWQFNAHSFFLFFGLFVCLFVLLLFSITSKMLCASVKYVSDLRIKILHNEFRLIVYSFIAGQNKNLFEKKIQLNHWYRLFTVAMRMRMRWLNFLKCQLFTLFTLVCFCVCLSPSYHTADAKMPINAIAKQNR